MAQPPRKELRFKFVGWQGVWPSGWYVLQLPTRDVSAIAVLAYREQVVEWLMEQDIILNDLAYLANGNTGDGPVVPSAEDGSIIVLMFRQADDVMRFHRAFDCAGVTPHRVFNAMWEKAGVPKFVLGSLARTAYASIRQMIIETGEDYPEWMQCTEDEQQFFLQLVQEYLGDTTRTPEQMHAAWLDLRQQEGWKYAPEPDLENKVHPSIVPFSKMPERDQHEARLTAGVIASLAPILQRTA